MLGIDHPSATAGMPTPSTAGSSGWFQPGDPVLSVAATTITVDWLNAIQGELLNILAAGGITPSKAAVNQVQAAITAMTKKSVSQQYFYFATPTIVAGGTSVIIGPSGVSSVEAGGVWELPSAGTFTNLSVWLSAAPGGTQTTTTNIWLAGSGSTVSAVCTGAAVSAGWTGSYPQVQAAMSVHHMASATAVSSYAHGFVVFQPS